MAKAETPIDLLRSPAHNVRFAGFESLRLKGPFAMPQLLEILADPNPWIAARAIWLLPDAGGPGIRQLIDLLSHPDARFRVAALRATMRKAPPGLGLTLTLTQSMADETSPHVRRTMLTHLRNVPYPEKRALLLTLATNSDFEDRTMLEAFGLAVDGEEDQFWADYAKMRGIKGAADWNRSDHLLAWRLHSSSLLPHMVDRICMDSLPLASFIIVSIRPGEYRHGQVTARVIRTRSSGARSNCKIMQCHDPRQVRYITNK